MISSSPQSKRHWIRWLVVLLLLLGTSSVGIPVTAAWILTVPKRDFSELQAPTTQYEVVDVVSRGDNIHLAGWYLPNANARNALLLVHGKDESRSSTLYGHFAELASGLETRGFAVLMIDLRGHGKSPDAHLSFGVYEQQDVLGGIDWLRNHGFTNKHIGVLGVSMGAASSIFALAQEPTIGALVSDCGFADLTPVVTQEWPKTSHLPGWVLIPTNWAVRALFHYNLFEVKPVDAMRQLTHTPVLIVHGDADRLINVSHAYEFQKANPSAALWIVHGADHAASYKDNPFVYTNKVTEFFQKNLGN